MSKGVPAPGASSACLHPVDVPAQSARRAVVLGVLLDRPRVSAGAHLTRHSHHADHYDTELGTPAWNAGRVVHQGNRRMDGDVSRLCFRLFHRVLGRQRARSSREDTP